MTRDYKPRRAPHRGSRKAGLSGGSGLAIGLAIGLAVSVGVHWHDRHAARRAAAVPAAVPAAASSIAVTKAAATRAHAVASAASVPPASSYDFYKILPSFEVVVPKNTKEAKSDVRPAPETRPGTYVIQAGSYKHFADADRIRAQLALQGIESTVQKVSVDKDTWHRIRIGPVSNLQQLNHIRDVLRTAHIRALVIRVGG
ncbi:MAG: SPOR domain-containing protein [Gammaproteobacteria bacterium]|nr:SPOR domain-containing protein [Gammaproteobacteria bacterium]